MTTNATKSRPVGGKPARKPSPKKPNEKAATEAERIDGPPVETVAADANAAKRTGGEERNPPFSRRTTRVHGPTVVHHVDEADRLAVERVLPTLEALQINKHVVPYLLACSGGTMHLSIALPGQNLPYSELPGLTLTIDPVTLDVSLDAVRLGPFGLDLIETGGAVLLEALRPVEGGETTPLGWRKDWEPHLAMMAGVVADAHAATRH